MEVEDPPRLRLPDDVLADILARLAPRSLAVSRCVCREWRAVVDDRCRHLLRPDLLPLTVGGIFVDSYSETSDFFARPSTARGRWVAASRLESFLRMDDDDCAEIVDCCNGLLLLEEYEAVAVVVNPATRRSVRLPPCDGFPQGHEGDGLYWSLRYSCYLAFDPMASPHYEVISMQHPSNCVKNIKRSEGMQWPPPVYIMRAYLSRTGRWEERRFALDDDEGLQNQRRITDGKRAYGHAAYWHGVLYVHCNSRFILRVNLSDDKYQVIDLPADAADTIARDDSCEFYLGKSKNGIYFTMIINDTCRVLVWFLEESVGKATQWVLKHNINQHDLITHYPDAQTKDGDSHREFKLGPVVEVEKNLRNLDWASDDDESAVDIKDYCDTTAVEEKNVDCDTGDEGVVDIKDYCETENTYYIMILGFHPYKEIVFLLQSSRVVAYHFGTSKVQDLGELCLKYHLELIGYTTFIYAPCWVGDLSESS